MNFGDCGVVESSNRRMGNAEKGKLVELSNRRMVEWWNGGMVEWWGCVVVLCYCLFIALNTFNPGGKILNEKQL